MSAKRKKATERTTMRLPPATISIIDANRGDRNRTEFMIDLVDSVAATAAGGERDRCAGIKFSDPCYYKPEDNR